MRVCTSAVSTRRWPQHEIDQLVGLFLDHGTLAFETDRLIKATAGNADP